jgi:hypothetical protein
MTRTSEEKRLEPINDTLNPKPRKFGMPWYVILGILTISVVIFIFPFAACKVFGIVLCPAALGFGWWLCKDDPKQPMLLINEFILPSNGFDPGK